MHAGFQLIFGSFLRAFLLPDRYIRLLFMRFQRF